MAQVLSQSKFLLVRSQSSVFSEFSGLSVPLIAALPTRRARGNFSRRGLSTIFNVGLYAMDSLSTT